jgi:methionyl-tRNA formyltransferase
VAIVITRPDRRRGRGSALQASPVKRAALDVGLRVGHSLSEIDSAEVDRGVVVAYGAMIPASLLERVPMLNVHFSLLPRWRGAAPVERAILAGDVQTGVAVMSLEPQLDTGPVHLERRTDVGEKTAVELTEELAHLGAAALVEVLGSPELLANPRDQAGDVTYAEKLSKETFHLHPTMTTDEFRRTVRLGRAYAVVQAKRLRIDAVHPVAQFVAPGTVGVVDGDVLFGCSNGALALDRIQPEGSRPMASSAWWAGVRINSASLTWA